MKLFTIAILFFILSSCNNTNSAKKNVLPTDSTVEKANFFPVTNYIKGQLIEIKQRGITPIKYITENNKTDSVMVSLDLLAEQVADFLHPTIDTANLQEFYTENKFLDQTLNAFTFSYDTKNKLPDSLNLMHWDVYVDAESGKVKRLFLLKKINVSTTQQLTWLSSKWCTVTTLVLLANGTKKIEKEQKILFDY